MTCPPCNQNCDEGRTCPAKKNKIIEEDDDIQEYKKPWVGLTPEEILDMFDAENVYGSKWLEFARAVEAKLKQENGYAEEKNN